MTQTRTSAAQRFSIWGPAAWAVAALLLPIGLSYPSSFDPDVEPRKAAWEYLSDHYRLSFLLLPFALIALCMGLIALRDHLREQPELPASIRNNKSLLFLMLGIMFLLPDVITRGLALPEYAQTYVLADQEALEWFRLESFGTDGFFFGIASRVLIFVGVLGMPLHETGAALLSRWASAAYGMGMLLLSIMHDVPAGAGGFLGYGAPPQIARILTGLLLAVGCLHVAWALLKAQESAELERRRAL